jgi:hypothetical protein
LLLLWWLVVSRRLIVLLLLLTDLRRLGGSTSVTSITWKKIQIRASSQNPTPEEKDSKILHIRASSQNRSSPDIFKKIFLIITYAVILQMGGWTLRNGWLIKIQLHVKAVFFNLGFAEP